MTTHHTSPLASFYKWVFNPEFKHGYQRQVERGIAFLIVASVIAVLIENTPEIYNAHAAWFHWFDVVTVGIFTAEYLMRVATAQTSAETAYAIATQRYKAGLGTYLNVLAAETNVLNQRRLAVDLAARALDTQVQLIRALGGGYSANNA